MFSLKMKPSPLSFRKMASLLWHAFWLALITIMQFAEKLPDRQAADAVRARLDWKYALGLELEDQGFDFSVLSEFRSRLIAGNAEYLLFDTLLDHLKQRGLVKAGGRQRTDATHVLAKVRAFNRVLCVGETFRATFNTLAIIAPVWLHSFVPEEWHARYDHRVEEHSLPRESSKRTEVAAHHRGRWLSTAHGD